jgi:nucleoid-associated protein YgaU
MALSISALEPPHTAAGGKLSPPHSPSPTIYTVGEGETLWLIAARANVYADSLLWPLLYKANRDQIKDPAQIFPGQQLSIPRNVSEADKEDARDFAHKSGIFPAVPVPTQRLAPTN